MRDCYGTGWEATQGIGPGHLQCWSLSQTWVAGHLGICSNQASPPRSNPAITCLGQPTSLTRRVNGPGLPSYAWNGGLGRKEEKV